MYRGFSLVEILLSVALLGLIVGLSAPVYNSFQYRNDIAVSKHITAQSLNRAQKLALAGQNDSPWGVKVLSGSIVIFKGATYITRDAASDEVQEIAPTLQNSGVDEVVFSKIFGLPSTTGDILFTALNNQVETLTINEKGTITH